MGIIYNEAAMKAISRRKAIISVGAAGGIAGTWTGKARAADHLAAGSRAEVEAEIRRRADDEVGRRYLLVDYYRIRRRLAYRLPVRSLSVPGVPVPTISGYPWAI
jgi:hypothetical protein